MNAWSGGASERRCTSSGACDSSSRDLAATPEKLAPWPPPPSCRSPRAGASPPTNCPCRPCPAGIRAVTFSIRVNKSITKVSFAILSIARCRKHYLLSMGLHVPCNNTYSEIIKIVRPCRIERMTDNHDEKLPSSRLALCWLKNLCALPKPTFSL